MIVWRITKRKWVAAAFTGVGAAENPGRWNSEGKKAIYCAESRSLAAWEILANAGSKRALRRVKFVAIAVTVPDKWIEHVRTLPKDWDRKPPGEATRAIGDRFLTTGKLPVLRVPSATVNGEFCFVLNPAHPDFPKLRLGKPEPFLFDGRVL